MQAHRSRLLANGGVAILAAGLVLAGGWGSPAAAASREWVEAPEAEDEWAKGARFFGGIRTGIGIPPGGIGVAPTGGIELGVSVRRGVGFGLHFLGMGNPPEVKPLGIGKADYGFGAAGDIRFYMQTLRPLTIYPTLSFGFLAGPGSGSTTNVVMPMINPGFGARVAIDPVYVAFEFGFAAFYIPFVNFSFGFQPEPPREPKPAPAAGTSLFPPSMSLFPPSSSLSLTGL